jgi:hypothetical protein
MSRASAHRYMSAAERFDAQHVTVPEAGCWLWIGSTIKGYGNFQERPGGHRLAHRYALEQKLRRPIAEGMLACHKCDTPSCVNPNHLYEGSLLDNARDAKARGRIKNRLRGQRPSHFKSQGVTHHSAKLDPDKVRAIRASTDSARQLAKIYGIALGNIQKVRLGITWKHVI